MDPPEIFVRAGIVDLGPTEDHFTSVYGGNLGKLPGTYFGGDAEPGYTSLGRLRVTVERVEEPAAPGA